MIVFNRQSWLQQVFFTRGAPLSIIWRRVGLTTLLAVIVTLTDEHWRVFDSQLTPLPFTLIGLALGVFLGFRNNTGYDRFWEGRKLWGRLINQSRSLARQTLAYLTPPEGSSTTGQTEEIQRELIYRIIGFAHALRQHLRSETDLEALRPFLPADEVEELRPHRNVPLAISRQFTTRIGQLCRTGWIDRYHLTIFETSLSELTTIQGACERIRNTPIPASYSILMHRIVLVYCMGLPFGIVSSIGAHTPIVVALVAYAFYGLDAAGVEVEEPFGHELNDLPLSALSTTIEINLRQLLGETDIPDNPAPIKMVLD